jgi:hypothetical protein
MYAVAVYTYARAGELEALTWEDVDLEHGIIQINKAIDRETGLVKSTKSGETRRIPIERELIPLLERLYEARRSEQVLWMPDNDDRAVLLRQHLERAGVRRADLFADNDRQKHVTFHDLRATGITWMAVRGDDPLRIKQRAGHASFSTTEMYIREAENLAVGFGAVFPSLPEALAETTERALERSKLRSKSTASASGTPEQDGLSGGGATGDRTPPPRPRLASRTVAKNRQIRQLRTTPNQHYFRYRLRPGPNPQVMPSSGLLRPLWRPPQPRVGSTSSPS